ncbi:MAG: L-serine ammonia-lyase, iron-sulfur-dependent, subunit alpha [Clostridia bacterium]
MLKSDAKYKAYCHILSKELVAAFGCTEPIALAYCASVARETLGKLPTKCSLSVCGNIIKNAKSVVVPNTKGLKGIKVSLVAGLIAGNFSDKLEVLSHINDGQRQKIDEYLLKDNISISPSSSSKQLYIELFVQDDEHCAKVILADLHTNIIRVEKDNKVVFSLDEKEQQEVYCEEYGLLNIEDIVDYANTLDVEDIKEPISRQIEYNTAISYEGINNNYGANIGKIVLSTCDDVLFRAMAMASAGSDARMSGCELPVIIVSGSGNQGMTASLPVIEYAKHLNASQDKLFRALVVSNLVTIHQKTGIGKLSAYCGAISAGIGSASGIAYLIDGDTDTIAHTIVNGLAISSGVVCDGAKPSCASKIAVAIYSGILGYNMYKQGQQFYAGDGLVTKGVEQNIKNIGRLAKDGMRETDKEIIKIMTE